MHILSLQPYFGGSHQAFQTGWQKHSCHDWTVLTLPPRHWKWRMRHAAVHFAEQLKEGEYEGSRFDAIVCTDFLNVAEFKGLVPASIANLPLVLYFHENQFAYPSRRHDERDLHFGFTNFTSCLAADEIWFNSIFNRDSFFEGLETACQKWPDFPPRISIESIEPKCRIQQPGIEVPQNLVSGELNPGYFKPSDPPRIIWAARWEHDKNPGLLLEGLREFRKLRSDFRLSIIGESFRRVPDEFAMIKSQFADHIDLWGFQPTGQDYWKALTEANVFLSTADHEFFGIAAAEAIAGGAIPLLPNRLAYPELLQVEPLPIGNIQSEQAPQSMEPFLYDGTPFELGRKLEYICSHLTALEADPKRTLLQIQLTSRLAWKGRAGEMDAQLCSVYYAKQSKESGKTGL